ncbi:MAG: hypothetical protein K9N11_06160 [Lentisphaeria bacterium]|nr:hypothetical protein [Candidatus Neomarinimicrobiota bacterium]MCF7842417.1 hypothetical protein [Lentisphaeria bacterium]
MMGRFIVAAGLVACLFRIAPPQVVNAQSFPQPAAADTLSLKMVGVLAASYLYQSYLNIGYLADLNAVDAYSFTELDENLDAVMQIIGGVRDELRVYSTVLPLKTDSLYVDILVQASDLLLQEAAALQKYMQTGNEQDAAVYLQLNGDARKLLESLLGLKDE